MSVPHQGERSITSQLKRCEGHFQIAPIQVCQIIHTGLGKQRHLQCHIFHIKRERTADFKGEKRHTDSSDDLLDLNSTYLHQGGPVFVV